MKKEKKICSYCGEEIEGDFVEIEGEIVCQNCYDDYYFTCEDCGSVHQRDYGYWIKDSEKMVCDNCINDYYYCEDCGDYFSEATYIENHGYVCEHCYDYNNYFYCDGCGRYYSEDYINYDENSDYYYCNDCYEENCGRDNNGVYQYHAFRDWQLFKGNNEETPPYYIGKEIELEPKNNNNISEVIEIMNKYINAVGMQDGSLNSGGVEIVTHPESWEYLQEHKENYKKFFEEIEKLEYGDNGNTGLHFHVTKPNQDVIARIIVILESFKEEIKKLSRRNGDFHWSKFLSDNESSEIEKVKYQSTKYLKDKYLTQWHDRYLALNLNNDKTIEFRFFNGANNFEEFWGDLQFIHNIMEIALDETKDINSINWQDLIYGEELIEQAKKQQVIDIDKKAKDTNEIFEKIETMQKIAKEEIKKTLKNFIRYLTRELETRKLEIIDRNDITRIETDSREYINYLSQHLDYLRIVTNTYKALETSTLSQVKRYVDTIKKDAKYYNKENKYTNYFKQIDKTFNKLESEVTK